MQPGATGLRVYGPWGIAGGYGTFTRALLAALDARGLALDVRALTDLGAESEPPPALRHATAASPPGALVIGPPPASPPAETGAASIFTMYEGERLPPGWVPRLDGYARVLVASRHCEAMFARALGAQRVRRVPLGVDASRFRPGAAPRYPRGRESLVASKRARVLTVASFDPRKNFPALLEAWLCGTRADDDAVLVVKTQPFDAARTLALAEAMSLVERRVGRSRREAAPMVWWGERLDDAALPGMYAGATHYVSASFGEGWDHPMTEACAMGLGLVAPRHTAYLDYLCEPWVRWVDVDRVAAFADDPPLEAIARVARWSQEIFAGDRWWRVRRDALAAALRACIDDPADPPGWVAARRAAMASRTWARCADETLAAMA